MDIYQMPDGKWAAVFCGVIGDGFSSREEAIEWILQKVEELLVGFTPIGRLSACGRKIKMRGR